MPGSKRKGLLPRRRRHDDEGEEEGSALGDVADYASTAGSLSTDAEEDGDVSNATDGEQSATISPVLLKKEPMFATTTDTEAMLNGLKLSTDEKVEDSHFDDAGQTTASRLTVQETRSPPTNSSKQRSHGHPMTPQRKGYFLHDDRSKQQAALPTRGYGRGYGSYGRGNFGLHAHGANKQWTHDLHDTINQSNMQAIPVLPAPVAKTGPTRSFSTTTVLGNVPVNISLPGGTKKTSAQMVKKHYTLLPQHRPPLRRDKPVRISIPDEDPRYIFPSTERSFIFIPRAMRPNQQQRARARESFGGSRRTSMHSYTPSVGMSRRPSIAASVSGNGARTPTARPVVRLPIPPNVPALHNTEVYLGDNSAIIHSPSTTLPIHQPVPQKTVFVADIESPATAPQQQPQQPFHQQVPNQPQMPHIPEGAIYAQPFQPFQPIPMQSYYYPGMMTQPAQMTAEGSLVPQQEGQQASMAHESNGMVYYYNPSQQFYSPVMMQQPYYYPPIQNQMFYQ
ncbi:hypothetical protein LTR05_007881 [Lithohypha guttulata]|uniref:Btz domain-containing protein n=1 Tax=Lithohypha guttulata TaxID=1690604 RepID=A0AAN7SUF0_9EURO|nr:hypothetical protein LTR05_007881 [Lithohypha guttulata]